MTTLEITLESHQEATIITSIYRELKKAERKHEWPKRINIFHQICIMQEEAGEVSKAAVDMHTGDANIEDLKMELRQTAAMCIRILKGLEE